MRTNFYDYPFHLDARLLAETLKKVVPPHAATALASKVLPVPGGPNMSTPFHALLMPVKYCGILSGNSTAYCSKPLALSRSAISSKVIVGLRSITYLYSIYIKLRSGQLPFGYKCYMKVLL